jgi:hypothetical protein
LPLLLIPILLAAIAFGFFRLYTTVANTFGTVAGVAALALLVAAILGASAWLVYRYRFIHGKTVNGQRILHLQCDWGQLTVNATGKHGLLNLDNQDTHFIFADIAGVTRTDRAGGQALALRLNHASQSERIIPMANIKQARRWERILTLAAQQKL